MSHARGIIMGWFDILKVDIDFDTTIAGFGQHEMEISEDVDFDKLESLMRRGKTPQIKDFLKERIRINHQNSYAYLKERLGREPKDTEIMEYVTRIIMHEGGHAGMAEEQLSMAEHQAEYGAYTAQFPQDTYLRLKEYLSHPKTAQRFLPPMIEAFLGIGPHQFNTTKKVSDIVAFVDMIVSELPNKTKAKAREKLARLEILAIKDKSNKDIREVDISEMEDLVRRYGKENEAFIRKLYDSIVGESVEFTDNELKMAGAVTTSTAPAMFNKVVRGRKKRRRKQ